MEGVAVAATDEGFGAGAFGLVEPDAAFAKAEVAIFATADWFGAGAAFGAGEGACAIFADGLVCRAMAGGGDKEAWSVVVAILGRDAGREVGGLAVAHTDVPAFGAEIFGAGTGVVFVVAAFAVVGACFAQALATPKARTTSDQRKLAPILK